jgi:hypothetical protein
MHDEDADLDVGRFLPLAAFLLLRPVPPHLFDHVSTRTRKRNRHVSVMRSLMMPWCVEMVLGLAL